MKTIKSILALAATVLTLGSCNLLDLYPLDKESPDTYFKNEAQLQTYTNTFYNDLLSDLSYKAENDLYFKKTLPTLMRGGKMRKVPTAGGGWDFGTLRNINTLFENIDNCEDPATKEKYIGVGKFFRALYYYKMVRDFGDVPWIDKELGTDSPELYKPRDSRDVVMQHMVEDIDDAIAKLPSDNGVYRINKWTALALKSRFCLFEGTWRKYHDDDNYEKKAEWYLTQAAEAAKTFIETSPYHIYSTGNPATDYRDLFASHDAIKEEIILARNFSLTLSNSHFASWYGMEANSIGINKKMIDAFLMADGTRFTDKPGWETMEWYEETSGRDPRFGQITKIPGYKRIGSDLVRVPDLSSAVTGYQTVKYDEGYAACPDTWTATDADLPLFRAAEVYLNYAEAKAELGSITQEDLNMSIKPLRDRAGMPNLDLNAANANPDDNYMGNPKYGYRNVKGNHKGIILEIRRERMVELAQENDFRWYDLMRWKEGKCIEQSMLGLYIPALGEYDFDHDGTMDVCLYKGSEPTTTCPAKFKVDSDIFLSEGDHGFLDYIASKKISHEFDEGRDYLFPIPTAERAMNHSLTQNPGWDDGLDF